MENGVGEYEIEPVKIGAHGWVLCKTNHHARAPVLHNDKWLECQLLAIFFPQKTACEQLVGTFEPGHIGACIQLGRGVDVTAANENIQV